MQLELPVNVSPIEQWAAQHLEPEAERLDRDGALLHQAWQSYVAAGWHELGGERKPARALDFLPALARVSGSFAILAAHQWYANQSLSVGAGDPWPRAGVSVGHLRHLDGPSPLWSGGKVNGVIPWMTGSTAYDYVLLGFRTDEGMDALAWVPGYDGPHFRHDEPMNLVAGTSTRTVRVQIEGLEVGEDEMTVIGPCGTYAQRDPHGILLPAVLALGNLEASLAIIDSGPRTAPKAQRVLEEARTKLVRAFEDGATLEDRRQVRAEVGVWAIKLATLATVVSGSYALRSDRPPQRLYREALYYTMIAQDEAVAHTVADHLLPNRPI